MSPRTVAARPELSFAVESAGVVRHAAVPMLELRLRVDAGEAEVRSIVMNAQIRIMAGERGYGSDPASGLRELFGEPGDWGRNLRSLLWSQTTMVVPAFDRRTTVSLRVPCGYDFDVVASKYLNAVRDGEIPLELLFSGSVFYADVGGELRMIRLPWDREARFAMPARLWHELMDHYYPNTAWLRVRRDVFDRLDAFRSVQSPPTWEAALERLLPAEEA